MGNEINVCVLEMCSAAPVLCVFVRFKLASFPLCGLFRVSAVLCTYAPLGNTAQLQSRNRVNFVLQDVGVANTFGSSRGFCFPEKFNLFLGCLTIPVVLFLFFFALSCFPKR